MNSTLNNYIIYIKNIKTIDKHILYIVMPLFKIHHDLNISYK